LVWNTLKLIKVFIPKVKMRKFKPRIRTWKLKDPAIASRFCDAFRTNMTRAAAENNCRNAVENAWSKLKDPLLCAATVVCGLSKNHQWRPETWWWNDRVASRFCDAFRTNMTRAAAENNSGNAVENAWSKLKDPLLCTATAVCGLSKNHQWRAETWWWNDSVEDAVKEKRIRYIAYNALKKVGKVVEAKEAKTAYNEAKRVAKCVVWLAKSEDERGYLPTSPLPVMVSSG